MFQRFRIEIREINILFNFPEMYTFLQNGFSIIDYKRQTGSGFLIHQGQLAGETQASFS